METLVISELDVRSFVQERLNINPEFINEVEVVDNYLYISFMPQFSLNRDDIVYLKLAFLLHFGQPTYSILIEPYLYSNNKPALCISFFYGKSLH